MLLPFVVIGAPNLPYPFITRPSLTYKLIIGQELKAVLKNLRQALNLRRTQDES